MGGRRPDHELIEALRRLAEDAMIPHDRHSRRALEQAEAAALRHLRSGYSFDEAFQAGRRAFYDALNPAPIRRLHPMSRREGGSSEWSEAATSAGSRATTV